MPTHQVDHNYGEPGPPAGGSRQTRRMLSRHQRNANELDLDMDEDLHVTPENDPQRQDRQQPPISTPIPQVHERRQINHMPSSSLSVRQRLRNNLARLRTNTNGSTSAGVGGSGLSRRFRAVVVPPLQRPVLTAYAESRDGNHPIVSRLRKRVITIGAEAKSSDEDELLAVAQRGGATEHDEEEEEVDVGVDDEDENDSDPEDNKPLQMMLSTTRRRLLGAVPSNGQQRATRRQFISDGEQVNYN